MKSSTGIKLKGREERRAGGLAPRRTGHSGQWTPAEGCRRPCCPTAEEEGTMEGKGGDDRWGPRRENSSTTASFLNSKTGCSRAPKITKIL